MSWKAVPLRLAHSHKTMSQLQRRHGFKKSMEQEVAIFQQALQIFDKTFALQI